MSNARLSENMALHFLKQQRVTRRNEVFDMTGATDRLAHCFDQVEAFDTATGQARPELPECKPSRKRKSRETEQTPPTVGVREMKRRVKAKLAEEELQAKIETQERGKLQQQDHQRRMATEHISSFLEGTIVRGNDKDYVKVVDLYRVFKRDAKRTKEEPKVFEREVTRIIGATRFKQKHQFRKDGRKMCVGKVFMNYKFRQYPTVPSTELMLPFT